MATQITLYEPLQDKSNNVARAPSKDSDQTGQNVQSDQSSLCVLRVADGLSGLSCLHGNSEDSDQIERMPKLI